MKLSDQIKAIKAKIDTPEKWTYGVTAKDAKGFPVDPRNPYATCYCLIGAADAVLGPLGLITSAYRMDQCEVAKLLRACLPHEHRRNGDASDSLFTFSDSRHKLGKEAGHAQVMELLDTAYAHADGAGL